MKIIFAYSLAIVSLFNCNSQELKYEDDVVSIQNLMNAYYESISGPIGQPREFDRLRNLFHPNARLIYSYWNDDYSYNSLLIMTLDEMINKLDYTVEKGFHEQEISNKMNSFSSIIQVFSTYKFWTQDDSISGMGITSYELQYDGDRYWIVSMLWTAENEKYKVPKKYLNKN